MPEIIETTVYQLAELDEAAKGTARAWFREGGFDHDWYDAVYADFEQICAILGIAIETRTIRLLGGGSREEPRIYFRGFGSQGDGACFQGRYAYACGAPAKIREYAPMDTDLHQIAGTLHALQRRNFYQLHARVRHRGHYYHEYCMDVSIERASPVNQDMTADAEEVVVEAMRDLARWLYRQLEREYEYQSSDECVDEAINANAYTFTGTGHRFG
jgi:hypothetical protein